MLRVTSPGTARCSWLSPRQAYRHVFLSIVVALSTFVAAPAQVTEAVTAIPATVYGWGQNGDGELGYPAIGMLTTPVAVNLPDCLTPKALAAGFGFSVVIASDGNLYSWGRNDSGQLGIGSTGYGSNTPRRISLPGGVTAVAVSA